MMETTSPVERLAWRPVEAAEALGVRKSSMYAWIAAGLVRAVKVGTHLRVPDSELRRLAEEGVPAIERP